MARISSRPVRTGDVDENDEGQTSIVHEEGSRRTDVAAKTGTPDCSTRISATAMQRATSGFLEGMELTSPAAADYLTKGSYGTLGMPASGNVPGDRVFSAGWSDSVRNLWLFGGFGSDSADNTAYLNDLWKYQP